MVYMGAAEERAGAASESGDAAGAGQPGAGADRRERRGVCGTEPQTSAAWRAGLDGASRWSRDERSGAVE